MPETRQQKSNNTSEDVGSNVAEVIKSEIDKYFSSGSFLESLKAFIQSTVEQACEQLVEKMVAPLREEIGELRSELAFVRRKCNDNEQYSRRANIRIFGIAEEKEENCMEKTLIFLNEQLGLKFTESDIDRVHRVGKPKVDATRAMIVKFMAYRSKVLVLKVKKEKLADTDYYVNEDLTHSNLKLLQRARLKYKDHPVWSIDGKVFIRTVGGKIKVYVPEDSDLPMYLRRY